MRTECARGFLLGATIALLTSSIGCPGQIDDPESLLGDIDCVAYTDQLIERSCAISGCHQTATPSNGNLALVAEDLGAALLDVAGSAKCSGTPLVSSTEPTESLMYSKLLAIPPCGDQMPLFARAPADFEIECMLKWVEAQIPGGP